MPVRPGFYIEPHFSVRSESDGIAKNERQLWVRILKNSDPYGYLPFPLRGASAGQRNASVARANQCVHHHSRTGTAKKTGLNPVFFAGDPYGTRTHVTTVKGWCLNRLTNGPYFFLKFSFRSIAFFRPIVN